VITPGQGTSSGAAACQRKSLFRARLLPSPKTNGLRTARSLTRFGIAVNEAHCVLKFDCGNPPLDPAFLTRVVPLQEHDFYQADDLAAALKGELPIARIVRIRER